MHGSLHNLKAFAFGLLTTVLAFASPVLAYQYRLTPTDPDISWLSLGNATGHLAAVELPAGLPIINNLRAPASGDDVIAASSLLQVTVLAPDYTGGPFGRRVDWNPWGDVCHEDGMQPVVCYGSVTPTVVSPMQLQAVSRTWVEESNILRTVMRDSSIELTTEDFISADRDVLVRVLTVTNTTGGLLPVKLFHYAPITAGQCQYRAAEDCIVFSMGAGKYWVMGSDTSSTAHQCGARPGAWADLSDGSLSNVASAQGDATDGVLQFGGGSLGAGESLTATVFFTRVNGASLDVAMQSYESVCGTVTGAALKTTTLEFWRGWHAQSVIPPDASPQLTTLIRRLLMTLKALSWDTGPIAEVPALEATAGMGAQVARTFAMYGHTDEAKHCLLASSAYRVLSTLWWPLGYDPRINDIIDAGFTTNTSFRPSTEFPVYEGAWYLSAAGDVWQMTQDDALIEQLWPFMKFLIDQSLADTGTLGTIAQNNGFQDDMLKWAFPRGDDAMHGEAGIECSYWSMYWVVAFEKAAQMAAALGYTAEEQQYLELAQSMRNVLETKFWNEGKQRYAYFHDPTPQSSYAGNTRFEAVPDNSGGQFVFPNTPLVHGLPLPACGGYSLGDRTRVTLQTAKSLLGALVSDPLSASPRMALHYTRVLYAEAVMQDPDIDAGIDWLIRAVPLAGMPESLPTTRRAVQGWATETTLRAIYAYLTGGSVSGNTVSDARRRAPHLSVSRRCGVLTVAAQPGNVLRVEVLDIAGRIVASAEPGADGMAVVQMSSLPAGTRVLRLRTDTGDAAQSVVTVR